MAKVINKVVYNNNTLIDLTADTVTASKLAQGYTAHSASGAQITGTMPEGGGGGEYDITGTTLASGGQQLDITDAGGGSSITVEPITITQNGTTTAPSGKAYSPITTNVPQTTINSLSITQNGTYTAPSGTAYSPITVNVSGGGGSLVAPYGFNGTTLVSGGGTVSNDTLTAINTSVFSHKNLVIGGFSKLYFRIQDNTNIESIDFPTVTEIPNYGLNDAFIWCSNLKNLSFRNLTTAGYQAFASSFSWAYNLTKLYFPELVNIDHNAFSYAFLQCGMTEIHFKASMRSVVEGLDQYDNKFCGGSSLTIYFDL